MNSSDCGFGCQRHSGHRQSCQYRSSHARRRCRDRFPRQLHAVVNSPCRCRRHWRGWAFTPTEQVTLGGVVGTGAVGVFAFVGTTLANPTGVAASGRWGSFTPPSRSRSLALSPRFRSAASPYRCHYACRVGSGSCGTFLSFSICQPHRRFCLWRGRGNRLLLLL